jgi:GNAT superfamily N-acetyltransferase
MEELMDVSITRLDPGDHPAVEAVLAVCNTARVVDVPGFQPICPYRFRAGLTYSPAHQRSEQLVARRAGEVVGYLALTLPMRDNLDNASLELTVHPAHRRLGIGTRLYQRAVDRLRELERRRVVAVAVAPLPGEAGQLAPGPEFATAMGAKAALADIRYQLELADPAGEAARAELAGKAAQSATGYRLVTWRDRTPEELLSDAAYLAGRVHRDAPSGELVREPDEMDTARVRQTEDGLAAARDHTYLAGAIEQASGQLVALTMLARQHTVRDQCSQWITIVEPAHRGHQLGVFVKLENLRHLRAHEPSMRLISTWTAESNHHMIRINQALGFRPVHQWVNWQAEL